MRLLKIIRVKNHGSVSLWMVNLMNMVSQTIIHCCNLLVLEGAHIYGSLCRGSAFVSLCTQFVLQLKILDLIIVIVCFFSVLKSLALFVLGFKLGSEKHTTEAIVQKSGSLQLTSGIEGLSVLKTTQVSLLETSALIFI